MEIEASSALRRAAFHPLRVAPRVVQVPDDGGGLRRRFRVEGERVRLVHPVSTLPFDVELVLGPLPDALDESFPNARAAARSQRVLGLVPAVPVADHVHLPRFLCPAGEMRSAFPALRSQSLVVTRSRAFT